MNKIDNSGPSSSFSDASYCSFENNEHKISSLNETTTTSSSLIQSRKNSSCNIPIKKRRPFIVDSSHTSSNDLDNKLLYDNYSNNENDYNRSQPSATKNHYNSNNDESVHDSLRLKLPSVPTHIEQMNTLFRQHYPLAAAAAAAFPFLPLSTSVDYLLAQQFLEAYRLYTENALKDRHTNYDDNLIRTDYTIEEHFRKSLGDNYEKFANGFITPPTSVSSEPLSSYSDSESNNSPAESTSVDSIEEHFARSLGKFWPLSSQNHSNVRTPTSSASSSKANNNHGYLSESCVDDHFAKALGIDRWEKLKENHLNNI